MPVATQTANSWRQVAAQADGARERTEWAGGNRRGSVHLYGLPAAMRPILELAERYHWPSSRTPARRRRAYTYGWGDEARGLPGSGAAFSFYPGKNLGPWARLVPSSLVTRRWRQDGMWRDHGRRRSTHTSPDGGHGRLAALQALFRT